MSKSIFLLIFYCAIPFWVWSQKSEENSKQLYTKGKTAFRNGDYQLALTLIQEAIDQYRITGDTSSEDYIKCYHKLGDVHCYLRENERALYWYALAEKSYRRVLDSNNIVFAHIQMDRGAVYSQMFESNKAISAFDSALIIFQNTYGSISDQVANTHMNIGIDLIKVAQFRMAEQKMLKAKKIFQQTSDSLSINFNRIYSNMGYLYRKMGDYPRALEYSRKALEIKLHNYAPDHPSVGKYYRNIGKNLIQLNRLKEAVPLYEKCLENQLKSLGEDHPETAGSYGELSVVLAEAGEISRAKEFQQKAIDLMAQHYPSYHPYRIAGIFKMGVLDQKSGLYESAISAYRKTIQTLNEATEPQPRLLAEAHAQLGRVYLVQQKYSTALKHIDTAIKVATLRKDSTSLLDQIGQNHEVQKDWIKGLENEMSSIQYLDLRARILSEMFMSKQENDDKGIAGLQSCELAALIIAQLRSRFPSPRSRAILRSESNKIYHCGIELASSMFLKTDSPEYLNRALQLSNASKAGLFRDHLRRDQIWQWSGLSAEEKKSLSSLQEKLNEPDSESADERFKYYNFEQNLREKNRRYAFFSEYEYQFSIEQLQEQLDESTVFLDYSWGEDMLVVLAVDHKNGNAHQLKLDDSIRLQIAQWNIQKWHLSDSVQYYMNLSHHLYSKLLEPILTSFPNKDNLILCLDGRLHHLSFSSLLTKPYRKEKGPAWFIRKYALQYISSASMLVNDYSVSTEKASKKLWMGFAPKFAPNDNSSKTRNQLAPLKYNQPEVEQLNKKQGGKAFIGDFARKSVFLEEAAAANVLHLATHAILDNLEPLNSGLFFSRQEEDFFLSANELYTLQIPAELAVLSACQTGTGLIQTGEGAMSLARAFRFAGVESVLSTKWLANDRSMATIMEYFYEELNKGLPKSQALRNAQIHYLDTSDPLLAHPYFWAGLSLSGNNAPLTKKYSQPVVVAMIFFLILISLGIYGFRSRREKRLLNS